LPAKVSEGRELLEVGMTLALESRRMTLHRFSDADAAGFYELNADPEVLRYTGDRPFASVAGAEAFIRSYDAYERYGYGRWSVYLRETGEYMGFCGLSYRPAVDVGRPPFGVDTSRE
jgi:[ribosomal protein S5]-alanine N-acetyltransferase